LALGGRVGGNVRWRLPQRSIALRASLLDQVILLCRRGGGGVQSDVGLAALELNVLQSLEQLIGICIHLGNARRRAVAAQGIRSGNTTSDQDQRSEHPNDDDERGFDGERARTAAPEVGIHDDYLPNGGSMVAPPLLTAGR